MLSLPSYPAAFEEAPENMVDWSPRLQEPSEGARVEIDENGALRVPDNPIICFIEGDGIGYDVMTASRRIWDAAVEIAYRGSRKIAWMETFAGRESGRSLRRRFHAR